MEFTEQWDVCELGTQTPDIHVLLERWQAQRRDGDVPVLESDTDVARLWCADHLMLLDELGAGDYVYRHYGAEIARAAGFSMQGRRTSDFASKVGEFFACKYTEVLAARAPLYTTHRGTHAKGISTWERLILPYSTEPGGPANRLLVYNRPMKFATELLVAVLDACTDGILAIRRTPEPDGAQPTFVTELLNTRAERMLGVRAANVVGKRFPVEKLAPVLSRAIFRTAIRGRGRVVEHEHERRAYRVTFHPAIDLIVMTITDVTDLKRALAASDRLASLDGLTGTLNRRAIEATIAREFQRNARYHHPVSLILLDIDHFKRVNDRWGHAVGDTVLKHVAATARDELREQDVLGRYGGEEFVLMLPETPAREAVLVAERLRAALQGSTAQTEHGPVGVTASFGVAERLGPTEHWEEVLERADRMLYRAKRNGRNRVRAERAPLTQLRPSA